MTFLPFFGSHPLNNASDPVLLAIQGHIMSLRSRSARATCSPLQPLRHSIGASVTCPIGPTGGDERYLET